MGEKSQAQQKHSENARIGKSNNVNATRNENEYPNSSSSPSPSPEQEHAHLSEDGLYSYSSSRERFKDIIEDYLRDKISRRDFRHQFSLYKELCIAHPGDGRDRYNILHELVRKGFTRILKDDIIPFFPECIFAIEIENEEFYKNYFNLLCHREIFVTVPSTSSSIGQERRKYGRGDIEVKENGEYSKMDDIDPESIEEDLNLATYNPYEDDPFYSSTNLNQIVKNKKRTINAHNTRNSDFNRSSKMQTNFSSDSFFDIFFHNGASSGLVMGLITPHRVFRPTPVGHHQMS